LLFPPPSRRRRNVQRKASRARADYPLSFESSCIRYLVCQCFRSHVEQQVVFSRLIPERLSPPVLPPHPDQFCTYTGRDAGRDGSNAVAAALRHNSVRRRARVTFSDLRYFCVKPVAKCRGTNSLYNKRVELLVLLDSGELLVITRSRLPLIQMLRSGVRLR